LLGLGWLVVFGRLVIFAGLQVLRWQLIAGRLLAVGGRLCGGCLPGRSLVVPLPDARRR